jgi:predicted ATPase/DNA-binding NarL/FixJ family response regulator
VGSNDLVGSRPRSRMAQEPDRRTGLPVSLTGFVGREQAIAGVREVMRRSRLVTLTGPGGVGKTRLAIEVARRRGARSAPAVAFTDLGPVGERAGVAAAVADAVGLAAAGPGMAGVALADWLSAQSLLIVLDNCERVAGACAELAAGLLSRSPGLKVLATSRESLGVPGEVVWTVAPLSLDESRRLFLARAREARPDAAPGGWPDDAVLAICRRLEGIPLALELAAAQVAVLSPAEIVPQLEDRLAAAWRAGRLAPARQQTLRASIEWSYGLLEPAERAAFARLAVFTGAFGREGASRVAAADVPMLAALAAKSMIYVVPGGARTRYRMLDTLRAFGTERLQAAGEEAGLRERHLNWWVFRAESCCGRGTVPASAEGFEQLCEDIDDLRSALRFAEAHRPAAGLALMGSTRELWYRTAQPEGLERSLRFLELCPEPGRDRRYALITAGRLAITVMDHPLARRLLTEALTLAPGSGDGGIEPLACFLLGVSMLLSEELDGAQRWFSRAHEAYSAIGDGCGTGRSTATLGNVAFFRGDLPSATNLLEQALAILIAEGDRWGQGLCHTWLGLIAKQSGSMRAAEQHLLEGIRLLAPLRDVAILGIALAAMAAVQVTGAPQRALVLAAAAAARSGAGGHYAARPQGDIDAVRAAATATVGADRAAAAWREGSRLLFGEAAALALGRPHGRKTAAPGGLSGRELEIAGLVAAGLTNAQVAHRLQLSPRTVENHVAHAMAKLGTRNRTELAARLADRSSAE